MALATLEFSRRFAMAHRLILGAEEKCATPHGHNEHVIIELKPTMPFSLGGANALASFAQIKGRWHAWIDDQVDHALQLNAADPLIEYFRVQEPRRCARLMVFPGDPTTEAACILFFFKLRAFLMADGAPFAAQRIRIEETPTNSVQVDAAFIEGLEVARDTGLWWQRADMSINDLANAPKLARDQPGQARQVAQPRRPADVSASRP